MRPRIRTIKPEFFKDEKVRSLPVGARYVAIGLVSAADDRGRLQFVVAGIRGHVFPDGDVSEKQVAKALSEIVATGFARDYEAGAWSYLWLPKFWKHQRINRPSESDIPAHPDDPYAHLSVRDALAAYAADSLNDSVNGSVNHSVSASVNGSSPRAQARVPVPIPAVEVEQLQRLCDRLATRMVANDPKARPPSDGVRWLADMRLLLQDRGGDVGEVERIIDWCQADPFWRSNILSPGKLRRQFTTLLLRAQTPAQPVRENASSLLRALDGGAA
jgi:hypothetical protein